MAASGPIFGNIFSRGPLMTILGTLANENKVKPLILNYIRLVSKV